MALDDIIKDNRSNKKDLQIIKNPNNQNPNTNNNNNFQRGRVRRGGNNMNRRGNNTRGRYRRYNNFEQRGNNNNMIRGGRQVCQIKILLILYYFIENFNIFSFFIFIFPNFLLFLEL